MILALAGSCAAGELDSGSGAGFRHCVRAESRGGNLVRGDCRGGSATWIDHHWVAGVPSGPAVASLCAVLEEHGVGTVFVHTGPSTDWAASPKPVPPSPDHSSRRCMPPARGFRALAWIGQLLPRWDGLVDLRDGTVRAHLVQTARRFVALGYDGVQYDLGAGCGRGSCVSRAAGVDPGGTRRARAGHRRTGHHAVAAHSAPARPPGRRSRPGRPGTTGRCLRLSTRSIRCSTTPVSRTAGASCGVCGGPGTEPVPRAPRDDHPHRASGICRT